MEIKNKHLIAKVSREDKQLGVIKRESLEFYIENNDLENVQVHGEYHIGALIDLKGNSDWSIRRADLFEKLSNFLKCYYKIELIEIIKNVQLERQLTPDCSVAYNITLLKKRVNNTERSLAINETTALDYLKRSLTETISFINQKEVITT